MFGLLRGVYAWNTTVSTSRSTTRDTTTTASTSRTTTQSTSRSTTTTYNTTYTSTSGTLYSYPSTHFWRWFPGFPELAIRYNNAWVYIATGGYGGTTSITTGGFTYLRGTLRRVDAGSIEHYDFQRTNSTSRSTSKSTTTTFDTSFTTTYDTSATTTTTFTTTFDTQRETNFYA